MIAINNLSFAWQKAAKPTLTIEKLTIEQGKSVFLHGASGTGKSTLLSLLSGVNTPQHGSIYIADTEISALNGAKRDQFRADHIGYIFQHFNLLPYLSPVDNVTLGCAFSPTRKKRALAKHTSLNTCATELLTELGLAQNLHHQAVHKLSVGQQQRVGAARAFIGNPPLIIADEPTSALDTDNREAFINLLFSQQKQSQSTLVFVSHDLSLAPLFDQTLSLAQLQQEASV